VVCQVGDYRFCGGWFPKNGEMSAKSWFCRFVSMGFRGKGGKVSHWNWMVDIEFYFAENKFFVCHSFEVMRMIEIGGVEGCSGFRGYTMSAALWVPSSRELASLCLRMKN
jgi:hypothetical protein